MYYRYSKSDASRYFGSCKGPAQEFMEYEHSVKNFEALVHMACALIALKKVRDEFYFLASVGNPLNTLFTKLATD